VVDRERHPRVVGIEAYRPARRGFHDERAGADLIASVVQRLEPGEDEEVAQLRRAVAAPRGDRHLAHRERTLVSEMADILSKRIARLEAEADADVVTEAIAHRQAACRADATSEQDCG
jgi:hypothetical protein